MSRVFVGMSGGVDSSVAASLLVEQGHQVTGVYMKNWSRNLPGMQCPWADDLADAKRVAVGLGIDFQVFDFEDEYKQKVVDHMVSEYKLGRTPNPDIMCNQEIKFKLFLEVALERGADMIATGHYARVKNESTQDVRLLQARDTTKDQTYFLYRVTSEALAKTLFPLGDYTKSEVREIAKKRGLWTASKKESMGICFVGQVGIREFLSEYVETAPGDIIDTDTRKIIGEHDGAIFYTLGQRHGLNVGGGLPYYVVGKDMVKNEIYVSTRLQAEELWQKELLLTDLHWVSGVEPVLGEYNVRVRHQAPMAKVLLQDDTLQFEEVQRIVPAGQSVVIYDGDTCLGGGIVKTNLTSVAK